MEHNDDKIESMLRSRRSQAANPDLAARILRASYGMAQIERFSFWQSLRQPFIELNLPKPGYVLAAALVLGMFLGFSTAPQFSPAADTYSTHAQSLLADDEGLL